MKRQKPILYMVLGAAVLLLLYVGLFVFVERVPWAMAAGKETASQVKSNVEESKEEVPVIRIFDKNMDQEVFDDRVAMKIMKKTGVKIEVMNATSKSGAVLEMMLNRGTYPDIVLMEQGEMVNRYIEEGAFLPLDDLIRQQGENITEMYGDVLERSRYQDGKLYWLANWYGKDTNASAAVMIRKDYLIDLVGRERAESKDPFTLSEYTALLQAFKEKYGKNGANYAIPLDLNSDTGNYAMTLMGIFGMKTYEKDQQGNLHYLPATERYREALLYLNQLYSEDLLCKEWVIDKNAKWQRDLSRGRVFSTWASYWDLSTVNRVLKNTRGEDSQFFSYKVVADDLEETETTYNGRNSLGWDAIGITRNCSDPEAAMRVLNYLSSEEGQYLMLWGLEGESWDRVKDTHTPRQSFLEKWSVNSYYMQRTMGVRRWTWCVKNGVGSDGTPYDLTTLYSPPDTLAFANERILESDYWDTAEYSGLEPAEKTELSLKWKEIEDLFDKNMGEIICASDGDRAKQLYDRMVSDMKLIGLEECEAYISEKYRERCAAWGL
ncbi:MAG: extracellular solute-binding protein [Lachnospiraceae bacterium]|nr:extracellular solute-binding protein [Lachnospiraceae bacterium]